MMLTRKYQWMIALSVSLLAVMACGQFSLGVITPTTANPPGETPVGMISEPTTAPQTSAPVTSPAPDMDPTATEAVTEDHMPTMAYLDPKGNVWVLEAGDETPRQLTFDANQIGGEGTAISYELPSLSSDGALLAYRREEGTPIESGYDYTYGLWVVDLATGEQRQVTDDRPTGLAWKPSTHLLAYWTEIDINYFLNRGEPDPALATGISAIDLDSGETLELVAPERGYALARPNWSPDGRFLAFEELLMMEGSGFFAYYDFEGGEYVAWDEAVGPVSWSPDGGQLAYSRQTYAAIGDERLYLRPRLGREQLLGPDYDGPAYATQPLFSPAGDQIAYLAFLEGPETQTATIMVLDLNSGEAKPLGQFEGVWQLAWTPDGSHLVFSFGQWESRQIMSLNVSDGSQTLLADGDQPSLARQ